MLVLLTVCLFDEDDADIIVDNDDLLCNVVVEGTKAWTVIIIIIMLKASSSKNDDACMMIRFLWDRLLYDVFTPVIDDINANRANISA